MSQFDVMTQHPYRATLKKDVVVSGSDPDFSGTTGTVLYIDSAELCFLPDPETNAWQWIADDWPNGLIISRYDERFEQFDGSWREYVESMIQTSTYIDVEYNALRTALSSLNIALYHATEDNCCTDRFHMWVKTARESIDDGRKALLSCDDMDTAIEQIEVNAQKMVRNAISEGMAQGVRQHVMDNLFAAYRSMNHFLNNM